MPRTLNQKMGDYHEAAIVEWIKGALQKASGSQWHRQGDAKNGEHLTAYPITADGKSTLGQSVSVTRTMWRKIREQTFNQIPAIFLRFYRDDRLREVEADLVVLDAQTFSEILADARKWQALDLEGSELYFCPSAEEVESVTGGGFDVCCEAPGLHVPLPPGEGTDALVDLLSQRKKALFKGSVIKPELAPEDKKPLSPESTGAHPQYVTHPNGAVHPYNRPCFVCGAS